MQPNCLFIWDQFRPSPRSSSSSSSPGGRRVGEEEERHFPHHLQTSNFCRQPINKGETLEAKYTEGGENRPGHNMVEQRDMEEMYQEQDRREEEKEEGGGGEPEDLTSSIERLRRSDFL